MKATVIAAILLSSVASASASFELADGMLRGSAGAEPKDGACSDYSELTDEQSCLDFCKTNVQPSMKARGNGDGKGGVLRCICMHDDEVVFDCKNPRSLESSGDEDEFDGEDGEWAPWQHAKEKAAEMKCRAERRARCHTECASEGIANGGHDCRVACRAKIDCGDDDGDDEDHHASSEDEFDGEDSEWAPWQHAKEKAAEMKCRAERRARCHSECASEGIANGGHDCRVECRAKIDCGDDDGDDEDHHASSEDEFDGEDSEWAPWQHAKEKAAEMKCRAERRARCHSECASEGIANGGHDCRVECRAKIDCGDDDGDDEDHHGDELASDVQEE